MDNLESSRHSISPSPIFKGEYLPIMNWKFLDKDLENQMTYDTVRQRPPWQVTPKGKCAEETLVVTSERHQPDKDTTYEIMTCNQDTEGTTLITRAVMETQC